MENPLLKAASAIKSADTIFISAGAGMGVDSGLPDFRGNKGFWKEYPLLKEAQLSFQDLANPDWFDTDPRRAWGFYGHRFNLYNDTKPHEGFHLIQEWVNTKGESPFVFTSNVDGHFQKSGFNPGTVYECHGSIQYLQCQASCEYEIWKASKLNLEVDEVLLKANGELPKCPYCSEVARPNILMFGDFDWIAKRSNEQYRHFVEWQRKYSAANIVTIEMGAGKAIPTVRLASDSMPGTTIRINPIDSDGNENTVSIAMGALEALNHINKLLNDI